ncbi:MAG TPA: Ig-like domain-containing protein [Steroidobacteraceae bacterium]
MRKLWSTLALLMVTAILAACGGSDNAFQTTGSTSSGPNSSPVAKIMVASSAATLPPDGTTATITVTATDGNNVAVSGAAVTFATSAGTLAVTSGTTSATGQATATLSATGVAAATVITVTATAGTASGKTTVTVASTQQTLTLSTTVPQIPSNGSTGATLKALVRDANNNVQTGVPVTFSATSGQIVVTGATGPGQGTTDATGTVTATLNASSDPQDRDITVTATAGASSAMVTVSVIGTSLSVSGPGSLVLNVPGTYTVAVTDSGKAGIPNTAVTLSSLLGNGVPATVTTDAQGQAQFTLTPSVSGADVITVKALGLVFQQAVTVSGQSFGFSLPLANAQIPIGMAGSAVPVTVRWLSGTTPQAGKTITFAATRGTLSSASAVTAADGTATVTVFSTSAGPATISAADSTNVVSAQVLVDFVATTPNAISMQASPSSVGLGGSSTITATIRDAQNNLVPNQPVDFSLSDVTQGSLSQATAITDAQGQASTLYTANTVASATNGVVVTGVVQGTGLTTTTTLTVGGQTVFLSLGTGNLIDAYSTTQYGLAYSVQAVDANGAGVPNVPITFTVKSLGYAKGFWNAGTPWTQHTTTLASDADDFSLNGIDGCQSEDLNGNGILDVSGGGTEDYNGNGRLDPGLVVSTAEVAPQSSTTGADGSAAVTLIYPRDHARWVAVELTATATVNGTQNSATATFWLPILAADIGTATVTPPGVNSPYGQAATCLNPN